MYELHIYTQLLALSTQPSRCACRGKRKVSATASPDSVNENDPAQTDER